MSTPALTAEQQLDVLWKALGSSTYWISVDFAGKLVLSRTGHQGDYIGGVIKTIQGSREDCIAELLAMQVAERLDDKEPPRIEPVLRTEFDLPLWGPSDRNRNNRR